MATKQVARRGGKKGAVSLDFTGVTVGGGRLLPEAVHQFECVEIDPDAVGSESGEPYWACTFEVVEGDFKGTKAWDNFSLQAQSLWKLRSFLEAAGYPTEDGPMEIDPNDLVGLIANADVIHEDYKGRTKHRINSWIIDQETDKAEKSNGGAKKAIKKTDDDDAGDEPGDWKVKQEVSFRDGKKTLSGRIKSIDGNDVVVTVPKDGDYEMTLDDLIAD